MYGDVAKMYWDLVIFVGYPGVHMVMFVGFVGYRGVCACGMCLGGDATRCAFLRI